MLADYKDITSKLVPLGIVIVLLNLLHGNVMDVTYNLSNA